MLMAKQSLMEDIDMYELLQRGPQNKLEELRIDLYQKVNALGIGAQGLGGLTTVLDVKINTFPRSEEHTSELQSLMRISYAVFCLKNKKNKHKYIAHLHQI